MTTVIAPPAPAEDADLDKIFQAAVTGITGLPGDLVRPRWQVNPPKQPEASIDWCAIGVIESDPDSFPAVEHVSESDVRGVAGDLLTTHEQIQVLASFYGPNAKRNSGVLRDGLKIERNRWGLTAQDISLVWIGSARTAPELVNQKWIRRYDMPMWFNRKIARLYNVPNIVEADVHLFDDSQHVDDLIIVPPT